MGSPHPLDVSNGPGWKLSRFVMKIFFAKNQINLAFHRGPGQPPAMNPIGDLWLMIREYVGQVWNNFETV